MLLYTRGGLLLAAISVLAADSAAQAQYFRNRRLIPELDAPTSSTAVPALSADELYMVFTSTRPGGLGSYDLYETRRSTIDGPWSPPTPIAVLNSTGQDGEHCLSEDGLTLYFVSARAGNLGPQDIYLSQRATTSAPWGPPQNLGAPINQPGATRDDPFLTRDQLTLFFMARLSGFDGEVVYATRPAVGAPFGTPVLFAPASSPYLDHAPLVEGNGGIVWFASNRAAGGGQNSDFYMVTRNPTSGTYSSPVRIPDLSTTGFDTLATRGIRTGRMYISQFDASVRGHIFELQPVLPVLGVAGAIPSAIIPQNVTWTAQPPRPVWRRVFDVSIQASQIVLEWYRGIASPAGTLCMMMGDFARIDPPLSASLLLPGAEGGQFVTAGAVVLQFTAQAPNVAAGLQTLPLGIPNDPSYLGLEVHLQSLVFDLQTNVLTLSEPATVHLVN